MQKYSESVKTLAFFTLLGVLFSRVIAQAQELPLPKADANGNYMGNVGHYTWVVVDPDPNGLNCRWSNLMPADWYSPTGMRPIMTVKDWPVARRFRSGSILNANGTPAGFAVIYDDRGLPWLKVSIGANDQICLVRANTQFIRPIPPR